LQELGSMVVRCGVMGRLGSGWIVDVYVVLGISYAIFVSLLRMQSATSCFPMCSVPSRTAAVQGRSMVVNTSYHFHMPSQIAAQSNASHAVAAHHLCHRILKSTAWTEVLVRPSRCIMLHAPCFGCWKDVAHDGSCVLLWI
jgi:hypothetical protein